MATWNVRLFAHLREKHGPSVTVEAESTACAVLEALEVAGIRTVSCRLAVNDEFATRSSEIPDGAELALIPPVSGG